MTSTCADPILQYAEDVVSGRTVAGALVVRACERHLHDLQHGHERGLKWSLPHAMRFINFCRDVLRLNGGQFEGKPFILQPWQAFVCGSIFGWLKEDGFRRFRTSFVIASKGPLALDTPIPTPSGWRQMGELDVGDHVLDEKGSPTQVVDLTPIFLHRKCYRLKFYDYRKNDIVAEASHLWPVNRRLDPKTINDFGSEDGYRLRSTEDIFQGDAPLLDAPRFKSSQNFKTDYGDRSLKSCEPCESVPVRCIEVANPSHLFLAGEARIVTHNSGKSPMAAAVSLYMLVADGEERAEVYVAAAKLTQAQVLFRDAVAMVKQSGLNRVCVASGAEGREWNIYYGKTHSWLRAIGSDKNTQEGPRPHCAALDELHQHPSAAMVDTMRRGTKFRQQSLMFEISNSSESSVGVCADHEEYSRKLLNGFDKADGLKDDAFFSYVCQLDPCAKCASEGQTQPKEGCEDCDDWRDESVWPKVSPSLPEIPGYNYIREMVREAEGMPNKQAEVLRLIFCIRGRAGLKAIDMQSWEACGDARERISNGSLKGKPCHGAIDIGATSDFTAFTQLFPHDDTQIIEIPIDPDRPEAGNMKVTRRSYTLIPHFWLPKQRAVRDKAMEDVIDNWIRFGWITETPGNVTDYDMVIEDIKRMDKVNPFTDIALDWGFQGAYFATKLQNYFGEKKINKVHQGIISMNVPFRMVLEGIKQHTLHHGKHPVMTWMMGNVVAETRGGLIKPSKDASIEKIDGVTSLCMAVDSAMKVAESGGWFKPGIISGREFDN